MPTTVQLEQGVGAWLEFQVLEKDTDLPIPLVERTQVRVFYKKHGELSFTQKTPLATVADKGDVQPGENFVEIGFGIYAIYFSATDLDTLETFMWVVTPDNPGALDFKQFTQQVDIVVDTDFIQTITDVDAKVDVIDGNVTQGFTDTTSDLADLDTKVTSVQTTVDATAADVTDIKNTIPAGITVSFVEGG